MSATSEIAAIKSNSSLSEEERVWKALEKLADLVDRAPQEAMQEINRKFSRGGL
jgi:hypothetical protein